MAMSSTLDTISPTRSRWTVDRWFYVTAAVFVIILQAAGFGPSLIDDSMRNDPPSRLVIVHGLVAGAWLLLFVVQAALVATGRISVHRRLGAIAPALTLLMVVLAFQTTLLMVQRGYDLSGDLFRPAAAPGAPVPSVADVDGGLGAFVSALNFGILVAVGWWHRRRPEFHKRLMLLAVLSLASVPTLHLAGYLVGRWPELLGPAKIAPFAANLLLFTGAMHDKATRGRIHPISLWVPLAVIATMLCAFAVSQSSPWHHFAAWLAS